MTGRLGRRGHPLWVVKLGGSLGAGTHLADWLATLATGGGRVVLVPGGGGFADAVRAMQRRWGFADAVAHRLALLAMEQYGLMLAGLQPGLRPAGTRAAISRALAAGEVPVWMPTRMALGRQDIPESWDVTSDSLAAWLAAALAADALVLVKSVPVAPGSTAEDLARQGVVDPLLPRFLGAVPCRCIEASRHGEMRAALAAGHLSGAVVTATGHPG
jgi:aspartokinase-like uncharacterized kinase